MGKVMIIGCFLVALLWVVFAAEEDATNDFNQHKVQHHGQGHHHGGHHRHHDPSITTCGELGMCCQGKNNTCRAHGKSLRENGKHKYCYCDSHCKSTNDCCLDYEEACPSVDCILDDWSEWGACSKLCGTGEKKRTREVLVPAMNNGKPCGKTQERAYCSGKNCKFARHSFGSELRETGKIIPAAYGTWRFNKRYSPYKDIRKNLFNHYSDKAPIDRPVYSARFEITESRAGCKLFQSNPAMYAKGSIVCVECQPLAMKRRLGTRCHGNGVYLRETRWNAVTVPGCHGKWEMKTKHEDRQCNPEKEISYILI